MLGCVVCVGVCYVCWGVLGCDGVCYVSWDVISVCTDLCRAVYFTLEVVVVCRDEL